MPIIESQLIEAHILEDYFVDKSTGLPLAAGIITLYVDSSRQTLKNWYYQDGSYPNYSFKALPNPLVLSSVGTIQDVNGNDVIPFFYPYVEDGTNTQQPYYITVTNSQGLLQFTRQRFPFLAETEQLVVSTFDNLIINNRFWRNITLSNGATSQSLDLTNQTNIVVCPSQHDGFSEPDIRFKKITTGGADSVTFNTFAAGTSSFSNSIRPEYYLNHKCTTSTVGDSGKYYQFPISLHLKTLDAIPAIFSIWAKGNGSNANNVLNIQLVQYFGSDNNTSNTIAIGNQITLTDSWQQSSATFTFQPSTLAPPTLTGDDAFYLRILLPSSVNFDINIAIPSIYLGNTLPTTDFQTYDQIDPIINGQRTGDVKMSLNSFNQFGWVPANNGSIGNYGSTASSRASVDTWPLYNLIWSNVLDHWAPVSGGRGLNAVADFIANKPLTLTQNLGRVMAGLNPILNINSIFTVTFASNNDITLSNPTSSPLTIGTPIQVYNVGGGLPTSSSTTFSANTIYYVTNNHLGTITTTSFALALTLEDALIGYANAIIFTGNGTGTQHLTSALGAYEGESQTSKVPNHVHTFTATSGNQFWANIGPLQFGSSGRTATNTPVTISGTTNNNTSGVTAISLKQPTIMMNVMIKL